MHGITIIIIHDECQLLGNKILTGRAFLGERREVVCCHTLAYIGFDVRHHMHAIIKYQDNF